MEVNSKGRRAARHFAVAARSVEQWIGGGTSSSVEADQKTDVWASETGLAASACVAYSLMKMKLG
jgi:hypothetical protein